jgi:MSHA biogenesis protein MshJ
MSPLIETLKSRLTTLDERFRERTVRERAMLTAGFAACVLLSIDHLAIQPISHERQTTQRVSEQLHSELGDLRAELADLTRNEISEQERLRNEEREQLREQLVQIERRLAREVDALVPPKAIVSLLEEVLASTPGLELIRVESQPPVRIGAAQTPDPEVAATPSLGPRLFRHGLEIEVEGSYPATLDYIERLEASRWNLLWDGFELEVSKFPTARVRIDLHTISGEEEWVGV